MIPILRQLVLLAAMAAAPAALAQQAVPGDGESAPLRRYALEFILFRYDDSVSAGTEVFPPEVPVFPGIESLAEDGSAVFGDAAAFPRPIDRPQRPGPDGDSGTAPREDRGAAPADGNPADERPALDTELDEIVTDAARIEMQVLRRDQLTMTDIHEKLRLLDAYEPVLWSGWTQSVLDESSSPSIELRRLGRLPLEFEGSLTLYLGRFVHLVVDVALEDTAAGTSRTPYYGDAPRNGRRGTAFAPATTRYRIQEDRIMRNGDLRYFDHPKLGLIAKLTLVEAPEPEEDDPLPADDSDVLLPSDPGGGSAF